MVTSEDAASLGGVYKLVAVRRDGEWEPRLKLSEDKATYPGLKQVYRFVDPDGGRMSHDVIATADETCPDGAEPLLQTVMQDGVLQQDMPGLGEIQQRAGEQFESLPEAVARLDEPAEYPVRVSEALQEKFDRTSEKMQ